MNAKDPLVRAAERICWLVELIASYDDAADPEERSLLVEGHPDLGRFLEAADEVSEWDRDEARNRVGAGIIVDELRSHGDLYVHTGARQP